MNDELFVHWSPMRALGGDVLWQWRVTVAVNFDIRCGALALNRLVIAVPLSSKALESCMMPQIGLLFAPGLQRAFCMNPATFAVLQQAGRGVCMAFTSRMWVSTSKSA